MRAWMLRPLLAALVVLLPTGIGGLSTSAAATEEAPAGINIDHYQVSEDGEVSVVLAVDALGDVPTPTADDISVTIAGEEPSGVSVTQLDDDSEITRTVVLALDASDSMRRNDRWGAAQAAAKAFLESAPEDVRVGLVTFSGSVQDVVEPTTDHASVAAAIDDVELTFGTNLYDAVIESVALTGEDGARSVLLLSDGQDTGNGSPIEDAAAAAADSAVVVDVVALQQGPRARQVLSEISSTSGGATIDAASPAALAEAFASQAESLNRQLLLTFPQPADPPAETSLEVTVASGGRSFSDSVFVALTPVAAGPKVVTPGSPLIGTTGLLVGAVALALGLAGLLTVVLIGEGRRARVERQLASYFGASEAQQRVTAAYGRAETTGEGGVAGFKESAVGLTSKLVKGGLEAKLTHKLSGGGSKFTAAEWLLLHAGTAVGAALVGFMLNGPVLMLVMLVAGILLPWLYLNFRHSRRLAAFNSQLAETLTLMAGGLQAGLSLPQALDSVVQEGQEPMSGELRRALGEQRLGISIEEALDGVADRMASQDFSWVVMAVRIQREVGGNLAELLTTVADTLRERDYLRRQVKVLTAEGRFSAWILAGLPVVLFCYLALFRADYLNIMFVSMTGILMLCAGVVLLVVGFFVLSRLVKVEV